MKLNHRDTKNGENELPLTCTNSHTTHTQPTERLTGGDSLKMMKDFKVIYMAEVAPDSSLNTE